MADTTSPEVELQADDIVGDDRRLKIYSVNPGTGDGGELVGEVWQGEEGDLHGIGLTAVLLFEPVSMARYKMSSIGADASPLTVFHSRISRSPFLRAEVVE